MELQSLHIGLLFSLVTFTLLSSLFLHRKGTYPQRQRIILIQKMS
ncbi:hypothetical protein U769_24700 [Pseudomonas aeruginosa MTB-1]|nr:hypothetical protein U769_24700 [Pseudomonas aeruginosa MTB-1]